MIIKKAELVVMAVKEENYPTNGLPEIMFLGRSNVGKSSFINALVNRKNLAYTSSTPGKTRTLNFYNVNDMLYFVDVPGYGYAQVSKKERERFGKMIENYLLNRKELKLAMLLVDFRHEPMEDDVLMYNYLKYYNINTIIVGTKADKVGITKHPRHLKIIREKLNLTDKDVIIPFSSVTKYNLDKVWEIILEQIKPI